MTDVTDLRRASLKGSMTDRIVCRCGTVFTVTESHVEGAYIGALEQVRTLFRQLHNTQDCKWSDE